MVKVPLLTDVSWNARYRTTSISEPGQRLRIVGVDLNRLEVRAEPTTQAGGSPPATGEDILTSSLEALGLEPLDHTNRT